MGSDCGYCSKEPEKAWPLFFLCRRYWKNGSPRWRVFKPHPPDWMRPLKVQPSILWWKHGYLFDSATYFPTYFLCSRYRCCALAETQQGSIPSLVLVPCHTVTVLECVFTKIRSALAGVAAAALGRRWQAPALAPRSHHKEAIARLWTGDQQYPVLCHCQLGQDIPSILLRSLFFFLGFCQWQSRSDRAVNLKTIIWLPLVWRTWTWALASTRPQVLAWYMGRDYSYCRASELIGIDSQVSGFVSWFLENTQNTKAL